MNQASKVHIGGALTGVFLLVLAVLAPLVAAGYVPHWNEKTLDLKHETPVLDQDIAVSAYTAKFYYDDNDGKEHKIALTSTHLSNLTGVLNSTVDTIDSRVLSIDLGAGTLNTTDEDYDHNSYVIIEIPEKANILWAETIREICHGFEVESGNVALDEDEFGRSYTLTFGSGDATLFTTTIDGDSDTGLANSAEAGDCLAREDSAHDESEVGQKVNAHDVMAFLNDAYLEKDANEPTTFWFRVDNVRAQDDANQSLAAELGDVIDIGLQFYTYPVGDGMTYASTGSVSLVVGLVVLAFAIVATTAVNVPSQFVNPNVSRTRGGGL